MPQKLISGDNHIDLTYCPADLWSSQAPAKWKKLAPRVEERNDGQHWFVDDTDRGMWNGVGPGFLPYTKRAFDHIDEMKGSRVRVIVSGAAAPDDLGIAPRRSRPRRTKEIIYGCLMVNDLIDSAELRACQRPVQRLASDFAKRSDPSFAGDHPQHRSRHGRPRYDGAPMAEGRRPAFKRMTPPLTTRIGSSCGKPGRQVRFALQGGARPIRRK
jgi:hypothetical protein